MDKNNMVFIIIIYCVFMIYPICNGTSDIRIRMKFILEKEEIIVSSGSTITTKADSVIECIMLCTSEQGCETASYDRTTEQCKLDSNCNPETGKNKTGTLVLKSHVPTDCSNIPQGSRNGVYKIFVNNRCIDVYCDMTDGGWTVIQRRLDPGRYRYPISFMKDWAAYKKGFGEVTREYWLGNDNIFYITNRKSYSLRFDIGNWSGEWRYAQYKTFKIADEYNNYTLTLAGYTGTAGDAMLNNSSQLSGQPFSTTDRDNDNWQEGRCTSYTFGGWWFAKNVLYRSQCTYVNPNGLYKFRNRADQTYMIYWYPWSNSYEVMKYITMKIKHF